jgi:hypothetical protein
MSTEENQKTARRLIEEQWTAENLDVMDELCAPSYQHNHLGGGLAVLKQAL